MHFVARGADILEGLAEIAVALHRPGFAARLLGAGRTWREMYAFPRFFFFATKYERCVSRAREQLGADAWSTSYDAGRALTSERAMDEAHLRAQQLASTAAAPDVNLTERELEVLRAVASGLSSPQIAAQLVVSTRTVHAHLRSIFDKLAVSTRMAAAQEAARLHLV